MSITRVLTTPKARIRAATAFIVGAVALAGWTVYLALTLPPGPHHALSTAWTGLDHLGLTWAGVDGVECVALLTLGIAMLLDRPVAVAVTALLALPVFALDAWFDMMTSQSRRALIDAVALAAFVEVPLVVLLALIARHQLARAITPGPASDAAPGPAAAPAAS